MFVTAVCVTAVQVPNLVCGGEQVRVFDAHALPDFFRHRTALLGIAQVIYSTDARHGATALSLSSTQIREAGNRAASSKHDCERQRRVHGAHGAHGVHGVRSIYALRMYALHALPNPDQGPSPDRPRHNLVPWQGSGEKRRRREAAQATSGAGDKRRR